MQKRHLSYALVFPIAVLPLTSCGSSPQTTQTNSPPALASSSTSSTPPPTATASSSSSNTAVNGLLAIGNASLTTPDGYTSSIAIAWHGSLAHVDVGSNPPGKTGVVIDTTGFSGVYLNTTPGGRELPITDFVSDGTLGAIYPATSLLCGSKLPYAPPPPGDNPYPQGGPDTFSAITSSKTCFVALDTLMSEPRGGGVFDLNTIPNKAPIAFGPSDMVASAADSDGANQTGVPTDQGISWQGWDESLAPSWAAALNKPIGMGLLTSVDQTPTNAYIKYNVDNNGVEVARYVSIISSTGSNSIPGAIPGPAPKYTP